MLVFHSKLCPGFHCYRAKTGIQESITIPHYSGTMLAPSMLSFIYLFYFNFFIAFAHYFPDWAPSPYCASRAPSLGSGFWSWQHGKDRSVWPDWPHPVALWVASIDTQTHVQTCIHTHTIWRVQTLFRRSQKDDCLTAWPHLHLIRWNIYARVGLRPCAVRAGRADQTWNLCAWLSTGV